MKPVALHSVRLRPVDSRVTNTQKRIAFTIVMVALPILVLAVIEGLSSFLLFARSVHHVELAEESYVQQDTLLGWVSKPNLSLPNLYGRGLAFHTNAQGFRHFGEVAPTPPPGKRRVVCSGDSFTLGYGVSDRDGWCALLARDSSIETVNMGEAGYGVDQAYLWYVRDGLKLRPAVHIFAFITNDFHRMQHDNFRGYRKPMLVLANGALQAKDVPVPKPGMGPFMDKVSGTVQDLRMFQLMALFSGGPARVTDRMSRDSATFEVARAALRDLARRDSAIGATLAVVYLPVEDDYKHGGADNFRRWLHAAADRGEFQFVDVIEPYRKVRADSVAGMFIAAGSLPFKGAAGHYTALGNAWAAEQMRLLIPALGAAREP